ncbi:MAG: hypothetical protein JXA43_01400 [Candidatus Diapherotrites archaeon]|nr:hypothetical protein [Candidatus Diapherotrites archaeon]
MSKENKPVTINDINDIENLLSGSAESQVEASPLEMLKEDTTPSVDSTNLSEKLPEESFPELPKDAVDSKLPRESLVEHLEQSQSILKETITEDDINKLESMMGDIEGLSLPEEKKIEDEFDELPADSEEDLKDVSIAELDANAFDPIKAMNEIALTSEQRKEAKKIILAKRNELKKLNKGIAHMNSVGKSTDDRETKEALSKLTLAISEKVQKEVIDLAKTLMDNKDKVEPKTIKMTKKYIYYTCGFCGERNIQGTECVCKKQREDAFERMNNAAKEVCELGKKVRSNDVSKINKLNHAIKKLELAIIQAQNKKVDIPKAIKEELAKDKALLAKVESKKVELSKKDLKDVRNDLACQLTDIALMSGNPKLKKEWLWKRKVKPIINKFKGFKAEVQEEINLGIFEKRSLAEQAEIKGTIDQANQIITQCNPKRQTAEQKSFSNLKGSLFERKKPTGA